MTNKFFNVRQRSNELFTTTTEKVRNLIGGRTGVARHVTLLLLTLFTLGFSQNAWGSDASNARIYYDNSASQWSAVQLLGGHSSWSSGTVLSKITNTRNLYTCSWSWGGYTYFMFIAESSAWGGEGNEAWARATGYASNYSGTVNTNVGSNTYLYTSSGTSKGDKVTETKLSSYTSLNKTQTVKVKVSTNGGTSYSDVNAIGAISGSSYKFGNATTCGTATSLSLAAGSASATFVTGYTATTTLTAPDVTGYTFVGWYKGSSSISSDKSITIYPTDEDTYYAYYKENRYNVTATANPAAGGTVTPTSETAMGQISGGNITASNKTGYTFSGWAVGTATGTFGSTSTANTTFKPTSAGTVVASFTPNNYSVRFNAHGGTGSMADQAFVYDVAQNLTAVDFTAPTGYVFDKWTTNEDGTGNSYTNKKSVKNLTAVKDGIVDLYAQWKPLVTTITVNKNDGTSDTHQETATYSQTPQTWTTDTYTGHTIKGYYDKASDGTRVAEIDGSGNMFFRTGTAYVDANGKWCKNSNTVTLYAQWATNYTITLKKNADDGTADIVMTGANAPYNASAVLPTLSKPSRAGYDFLGYYDAASGGNQVINDNLVWSSSYVTNGYYVKSENATLYAQWHENVTYYTITYGVGTGYSSMGSVSGKNKSTSADVSSGASLVQGTTVTLTASPNTGYEVEGWYSEEDCSNKLQGGGLTYDVTLSANKTVYVKFQETKYTVNVIGTNTGIKSVSPESVSVGRFTASESITATAADGYTLAAWTLGQGVTKASGDISPITITTTQASSITANATENKYKITFDGNGATSGSMADQTNLGCAHSQTINPNTFARTGYDFLGWSTVKDGDKVYDDGATVAALTKTENNSTLTLYAKWQKHEYTISYTAQSTGWTYGTKPTTGYYGDPIQFEVNTTEGYTVTVASPQAVITKSGKDCSFTMPASDVTVNVSATENLYNVTLNCDIPAGATLSYDGADKEWGSVVSVGVATTKAITVTLKPGYKFNGSFTTTGGARAVGNSGSYTISANGAKGTVTAKLAEDLTSDYYLEGNAPFGGWTTTGTMMTKKSGHSADTKVYFTVNVPSDKLSPGSNEWAFKIYKSTGSKWYGWGNSERHYYITSEKNAIGLHSNSAGNLAFRPTVAGNYIFELETSGEYPYLTVTYPTSYKVNFGVGDGGSSVTAKIDNTTPISTGDLVLSGSSVTFHYTAKSGYRFTGWYTAASGGDLLSSTDADYVTTISAVTNVYAQFEEIKHTVTVSAGANGSIDPAAGDYQIGVVGQDFTATGNSHFYLNEWVATDGASVSSTTAKKTHVTATADGTVTANFAPKWVLKGYFNNWHSTSPFGNWDGNVGYVDVELDGDSVHHFKVYFKDENNEIWYGHNGTMTMNDCSGWQFGTVKNNCGLTPTVAGTYRFTIDTDTKKVSVTYPVSHVVNFSKTPAEGSAGAVTAVWNTKNLSSGDRVADNASVTFTAPDAASSYHFVCWKDGNDVQLSTDNPYIVSNISADVTVKAVYGGTTYDVTISSDAQGTVEPSGVQQVDNIAGTQITATPTTAGYVFDRWETTGDVILTGALTDNPNTVKATGTGTVTAKYKQAQVVYFKNTLGWSNVYVYIFNQANVFDDAKGVCPSHSSRVAFSQMTLAQGETDVYVYTYDGALENMKSIAFCKDNQSTNQNFYQTKAAYRSDYAAANPMFVPQTTSNVTKNETEYYSTGTWFPFNTNKNYYIKFSDSETQYPLVFTTAGSLEATIGNINLTAYTTYTFTLYDNAHPIDAEPVAYGREEVITYNKDNEYVSFTNTTAYPATLKTITGGNHTFSANFNSDVRPQIRIDFPTAYTLDYGVAPGGQSATAVRTGTTDTIASGAYVAPGQSVTLTQTAAAGCSFHSWNTKADGTGSNLSSDATYTFTMPASAHTAYALYNGADVPSSFQILGTFNNWASTSYMRSKSVVGELVYDSIYLEAGREYKFKVHNTSGSKWYGNTGIMTQAHCTQWTFTEGTGNCTLATTIAGWYKFTLNKSSISLNVTFPENEKQATMYDSPVRSNNTDVMIQAFYWAHKGNTAEEYTAFGDVKWAALNAEADTLAKYFDMVWLAPSQETADFTGYLPINYSQQGSVSTSGGHSPWGTSAQLRTLIDNLHRGGSKVIADIVINHSSAAHPDEGATVGRSWCEWGSFDFGRYGVYNPDYTWLAKGDEMFYAKKTQAGECGLLDNTDNYEDEWNYSYKGGTGSWSESEFNCAYSRDWAHKKQEIREMSRAYLTWMRDSIGYDGWRYDFVKGFHGSHLYDYNRSTGAYFSVAEVFDGDIDKQLGVLADAGRETYMFDFPGKFSIYNGAIRTYSMKDLKGNYNTLIGNNANKRYAVTFIDNHDSFHEGSSLYGTPNVIDDRQAQQAICYLFSMPGVPCLVYPYWNNYKEIVKKVIYARKAAGVHSESVIEEDWAGSGNMGDNYYTARIKGKHGYIFLKMGYDCRPQDLPMGGKDPDGRTWIKAWANDNAGVWYTTSDTEPAKYRLLITANGQTYYSNDVNRNGQTLSFYATPDAKYQWQKYEMFQWKDCPGTAPVALTSYVYTATFDSVNMAATDMDLYDGDYYIRTDAVGWNDYKKDNHKFTYFANASVAAGDAYHYYWVKNIAKSSKVNVHATVGNEYNEHVTNTLGTDQFTDSEGKVEGDNNGINIRFSYEPTTNYLGRAMILGSTNNKYLNVVGSNIYKEKACTTPLDESHYSSTPADSKLGDISDWVYERVVFVKITDAKPSSNVVIKSVFKTTPSSAEQTQYMLGFQRDFYGNLTDDPVQYAVLDAGTTKSETTAYCIRVIYDFKTNRLVGAWEPVDQVVTDDWNIDADVLFKRFENGNTAQITFEKNGDTISSLKNVLFIMEFHRDTLPSQENLYWFSLPYDCNISSIYGVEGYVTLDNSGLPTQGTWGIQRYDGETRAKTGWFKEDTQTFWKWMSKDEVLHAGEGYVLDFDKNCATFNEIEVEEVNPSTGEVTKVKKSILRLYFPSDKPGFSMTKSGAVDSVVYTDHTCNIKNRKAQDSNWRLMSPGNYSNTTIANEKDIRYDEKDSVLTAIPAFIYRYDRSKDAGSRYTAVSALNGFTYKSFNCYMAQFSGAVKWAQFTKADPASVAARQYYAPGEIRLANLKLVMENSYGEQQDHTFIKLKKGATTGYDANADLTKIVNSGIGQVYSVSEDVDYAANVLPVESQTVALKVVAAKAGSYTFSMPDGTDGVTATLVDTQTGSRTDLSLWNYTVELGKGTYAGRFYLDINIHQTPTNVVVTEGDSENEGDKMMKFIENGQLYILKNGVIYDATGKIVK